MWFKRNNYKVKLHGRDDLSYVEGGKIMKLGAEMTSDPACDMLIFEDSLQRWQPPNDDQLVTKEDQLRIKANITKELRGYRIEWVGSNLKQQEQQ